MVSVIIDDDLMKAFITRWEKDHPYDKINSRKNTYITTQLIKEYINDIIIFNYNKKRKE